MALHKLKLVPRNQEEQRSTYQARRESFSHPWIQEAHGQSRLASTLVGLLISAVLMIAFLFVWTKLEQLTSPSPTQGPSEYVASSTLYVFSKPGLIEGNRVGAYPAGTRTRVVGTEIVDGQVWYEIEILSEHPNKMNSVKQKWVLATRLVMTRS